MIYILLDAQFLECQHTTDTEQDLLFDTVLPVASIELVGDLTIPFAIELIIGIQQIQVHAAYGYLPEVCFDGATRIRNLDHHIRPVLFFHLGNRQVVEVLRLVVRDLLAFRTQGLGEITIAIEETDGSHIDVAVRRLFDIVAGENTQTTRVDLEYVRQTILHREISDRRFLLVFRRIHIGAEVRVNGIQMVHEFCVLGQLHHSVVAEDVQQNNRVRVGAMPSFGIDVTEQILCVAVPTPP